MQPRREAEQTSWENQPPASGHGFGAAEDDAYETVKPWGMRRGLPLSGSVPPRRGTIE